jgi:hypothetical protein
MTNNSLSPAAQAVLDAFTEDNCLHDWKHNHYNVDALAAALRAAADQVAPYETEIIDNCYYEVPNPIREKLLAIAAELEGSDA